MILVHFLGEWKGEGGGGDSEFLKGGQTFCDTDTYSSDAYHITLDEAIDNRCNDEVGVVVAVFLTSHWFSEY